MTALVDAAGRVLFAGFLGGAAFLAPCAFPLLPGYVAFYLGSEEDAALDRRQRLGRAASVGLLASAGFFLVFAALGLVVAALGEQVLANISQLELVVGLLLVGLGVAMTTGRMPRWQIQLPERRRSGGSFFLFGVVYAVAAAGCTAPLFIGAVVASLGAGPVLGAATLLAYAAGMSVMMIVVTGLAAVSREQLLRVLRRSTGRLERAAGALLALAGVAQIGYYLFWLGGWQALFGTPAPL